MEIGKGSGREGFIGIINGVGRKQVGHILESVAVGIPVLIAIVAVPIDPAILIAYGSSCIIVIPRTPGYRHGAVESGNIILLQYDVDESLPFGVIFCRRVGDDLYPVD